jgi:hypothetical protein
VTHCGWMALKKLCVGLASWKALRAPRRPPTARTKVAMEGLLKLMKARASKDARRVCATCLVV